LRPALLWITACQQPPDEFGNLVTKGIIDPAKVVRVALQDGWSIAGLLITTEAMVAEKLK
jgi:chaperonin GroEL